ncbi:hypothetical protein JRQ81_001292 [Phrynocephalus forsythii]|uniref:Uncharacterized protein n=1 Tax=Phrynocephalus forsythii TaxID=171643 RepID=A0A9Q0Y809_9SAUR|nr:hypothetical protein JRQ81_001292 [Phrynocephalus forsythii]
MDDDPEPALFLGSREMSEQQVLSPGGSQKGTLENNDDSSIHQESGDNGPFMEQDASKKPLLGKEAPEQTLLTESPTSIFQSKELRDQSQPSDVSGGTKGSITSLRKTTRRSLPRLPVEDPRWAGQQPAGQPIPPLSQKSSRTLSINETEARDVTWVSKRTGKIMKCRSQQTSLIWERKALSDILQTSGEESEKSKGEESDVANTKEDVTSSGEATAPEEMAGPELPRGKPQWDEKTSKRGSHPQESRRISQLSGNEPILLIQKGLEAEEDLPWISQRTGKEMKNKAQQTSVIWELKTLSEILRSSSQESFCNMETDNTETEDSGDTELERRAGQESRHSIQLPITGQTSHGSTKQLDTTPSWSEIQPGEEQSTESHQKRPTHKADQAQQTDSSESLRRELLDYSQQTEDLGRGGTIDQQGPLSASQETDGKRSRIGSQELKRQESQGIDLVPPEHSQVSLGPGLKMGAGMESEVTDGPQKEPPEFTQEPPLTQKVQERPDSGPVPEDTWVSRRTGKVVRNQIQQTDKSWLQYCAAKMRKVKQSRSQQTDQSFLQRYSAMKAGSREALAESDGPAPDGETDGLCSASDDGSTDAFPLSDAEFSPVASGCGAAAAGRAEEGEPTACREEERGERQQPEDDAMGGRPAGSNVQSPGESESKSTVGSTSLYVEGEDVAQQTYSVISLEDGIWMNRRTGKILVSHTQQTSQVVLPNTPSATGKVGYEAAAAAAAAEAFGERMMDGASADEEPPELEETQPETDSPAQSPGRASQVADDAENILSVRLSEAMLLSVSYPDVEDETGVLYTPIKEGSWVNVKTGKLLASQKQQTERSSDPFLEAAKALSWEASGHSSEEDLSRAPMQQSGGEGMDDDPIGKIQEPL